MVIDFILDYKWYFFVAGEIIFWGSIIGFLLLRYVFKLNRLNKYLILLWLLSDLWLLTLGILDFMRTGHFNTFQIIIIIAVIYAFTEGKKDIKKIDGFVNRTITKWQS
ncbi:hypothetical protein [Virgibacillus salexigens]|uniref:Uncharacterized protein n=1 Tax=Virgibacillus kapii TaxID=1638645 RepID=A0ABQ2D3Z3_9BACI|nr:hypothetical protein [Virgibacillus kapii]GGJ45347.1 hypothetical protein GCM10007111_04220 [Virgibacillus kapii]